MRSAVDRSRAIPDAELPGALVDVMLLDEAARRHALAEGHADPDPNPLLETSG